MAKVPTLSLQLCTRAGHWAPLICADLLLGVRRRAFWLSGDPPRCVLSTWVRRSAVLRRGAPPCDDPSCAARKVRRVDPGPPTCGLICIGPVSRGRQFMLNRHYLIEKDAKGVAAAG